jgi:hypothetical protein
MRGLIVPMVGPAMVLVTPRHRRRCSSCNYNFGVGAGTNITFTCYRFLV